MTTVEKAETSKSKFTLGDIGPGTVFYFSETNNFDNAIASKSIWLKMSYSDLIKIHNVAVINSIPILAFDYKNEEEIISALASTQPGEPRDKLVDALIKAGVDSDYIESLLKNLDEKYDEILEKIPTSLVINMVNGEVDQRAITAEVVPLDAEIILSLDKEIYGGI